MNEADTRRLNISPKRSVMLVLMGCSTGGSLNEDGRNVVVFEPDKIVVFENGNEQETTGVTFEMRTLSC